MRAITFSLFIVTLVFSPLAFGSVETWSIGLTEALIFLTALTYIVEARHRSTAFLKAPGVVPVFLLVVFMWAQLIPLPPSIVSFISPAIYQVYAPILTVQDTNHWIPLTVNQKSTVLEALRVTSYAFFYVLTVQLLSRKELLLKTIQIIAGLATVIALIAVLQKFTSPDLIYWFRSAPESASPVGPWVYRNHYAGFMELLFPLVLALFFYYQPSVSNQQTFRSKAVSILSSPSSNIQFFLGFSVILIMASIFIGLSRGGIVFASFSLFFFLILLAKKNGNSSKILPLGIVGCVLLTVTWFGWDPILARLNTSTTESGMIVDRRWDLWLDCIPVIKDFFFTGSGFGTFIHVFPQYNTLPTSVIIDHAHNDYIELLTDGGFIGFLLAAWFVVAILSNGFKQLSLRHESLSILLIIGGLSALVSFLLHSIVDFNMHNGANGLFFFFLCGVLVSAGNTRFHFRNRPTLLQTAPHIWKLLFLAALPLLLFVVSIQGGILKAKHYYKQTEKVYISPQLPEAILQDQLTRIDKVIHLDPLEGRYSSYKGNLLAHLNRNDSALDQYLKAALKDPLEGAYLQRIGLLLPPDKDKQIATLMAKGYKRGLNKEQLVFVLAEWHLQQNNRNKAADVLQQGARQFPSIAMQLPQFFLFYEFTREEILSILPPKTSAWITLGEFMEKAGQIKESEYYRSHALDFLEQETNIQQRYFLQLYRFYKRQKQTDEAMATLHLGIQWRPDYAPFHIYLGDHYKQQNIPYRAREEYEQALLLAPGDARIRRRLQTIK